MKLIVRFTEKLRLNLIRSGCLTGLLVVFTGLFSEVHAQLYANVGETPSEGTDFYVFNPTDSTWLPRAKTPSVVYTTPSYLFSDGVNLYAISDLSRRLSVRGLFRYDTTTKNWVSLTEVTPITAMAGIVSPTAGPRLYGYESPACCPEPASLKRYDVATNTFTTLFSGRFGSLISGSTSLYAFTTDSLRLLNEANTAFVPKANPPGGIRSATGTAEYIYAVGTANQIYRYTIATDSWTTLPGLVPAGTGSLTTDGSRLYLRNKRLVYSYNLATGIMSEMPTLTIFLNLQGGDGGNLVYVASPCSSIGCIPLVVSRLR